MILFGGQEHCPIVHERPSLFKQIAPAIGRLDLIGNGVGQSHLDDVRRVCGRLGGPISERGSEAMRSDIGSLHTFQDRQECHV